MNRNHQIEPARLRGHSTPEPDVPPPKPEKDPPPDNLPLPEHPPVEEPTPPKAPIRTASTRLSAGA